MERRQSQRIPYAVPIRIQVDDLDQFAEQYSSDLSTGGVFIRTCRPYTDGSEIKLEFYFPEQRKTVPMLGTVIRSVPDTSTAGGPPGIAIQFRDLNQVALKFLELAIERYNVRHPTEVLELPADFFEYSEPVGVCNGTD
ncbi:MAG: PilZ domain-containing protein, partial [Planctomycetota bacterium]|nr:PilZ domain-containing protein [Planctomycetota bacterium]